MKFLLVLSHIAVGAAATWLADALLPGFSVTAPGGGFAQLAAYLTVGLILALVNLIVRPVVRFVSFPIYLLTLGLFGIVVNALMLELVAWISQITPVDVEIARFWWTAIGASLIITIATAVLSAFTTRPLAAARRRAEWEQRNAQWQGR